MASGCPRKLLEVVQTEQDAFFSCLAVRSVQTYHQINDQGLLLLEWKEILENNQIKSPSLKKIFETTKSSIHKEKSALWDKASKKPNWCLQLDW